MLSSGLYVPKKQEKWLIFTNFMSFFFLAMWIWKKSSGQCITFVFFSVTGFILWLINDQVMTWHVFCCNVINFSLLKFMSFVLIMSFDASECYIFVSVLVRYWTITFIVQRLSGNEEYKEKALGSHCEIMRGGGRWGTKWRFKMEAISIKIGHNL